MKKHVVSLRTLAIFGVIVVVACVFAITANADSTITIPVPKGASGREFTLSLRIPPDTKPVPQQQKPPKVLSRSNLIFWNDKPLPVLEKNDEFIDILKRFSEKGWVKNRIHRTVLSTPPISKTHAISMLQAVCHDVVEIIMAPSFGQIVEKVNLTPTDIEDLRRMVARFKDEFVKFGSNPFNIDKDLLTLQEYLKKSNKTGLLKVIKVEGQNDGSTVIHLKVN